MNRYIRLVIRRRWLVLGLVALVSCGAVAAMKDAVIASSVGGLFLNEHPDYPRYLERARTFGSDDVIVVAVQEPGVLSAGGRRRLGRAVAAIRALPEVRSVRSALDVQKIRSGEGGLEIETYAALAQASPEQARRLQRELGEDAFARGIFLSKDGRQTAVIVELKVAAERPAEQTPALVQAIIGAFAGAGYPRARIHLVGLSANIGAVIEETHDNIKLRFPFVVVLMLASVLLMFRRLWPVLITGVVSMVAVIWTMGFAILLDRHVSVFTGMVPAVVMIIAFSDVIHLCSAYVLELERGRSKAEAIQAAGSEVGAACIFTSVTTFVGFVSLSLVPTPASRQLGLVLGFGAGVALLLAVTLCPILFRFLPRPRPWRGGTAGKIQQLLDSFLRWVAYVTARRPVAVVLAFVALAAVLGLGLSRLEIETDFARRMADDHPLRQDGRHFKRHFAGANTLLFYVQTPQEQGLLRPEVLARVARFQRAVERLPGVQRVSSLVDLMQTMQRTLVPRADWGPDQLPTTRRGLAQLLLLFEISGGEELDSLVDFPRQTMVLRAQLLDEEFRHTGRVGRQAEALATKILGSRARVEPSGLTYLLGHSFNVILEGQQRALLVVFLVITLMMCVGLRSLRVGLWSMIPNLLPLFALGGYLGLFWDYVDSDVLVVAVIAIGIGVDDTIHFLTRLRLESRRQPDAAAAIEQTFRYSGRGIVITTVVLVLGFSVFATSDYLSMYLLGTLLPLTLVVALLADLFLVPALVALGAIRFGPPPEKR